ncbi:MAG TPA: mechanosensitive ion channel domain-containing protein [Methanoregulaceae archaeon]|nr:mechanosensitive ion channel domain-containing protein [Methanoregulaceae archaeon]
MADGVLINTTQELTAPVTLTQIGLDTILYILIVIVISYILVRVFSFILRIISEKFPRYRHPVTMLIPLLKIIIYFTALYYILFALIQPDVTQLIAFFGLFGAALGLGLKDLFADIVGGIVIIFEKPYQIGDKITIGNQYGEVKDIGIRSTKLVTPGDSLVSVPNFVIFSQAVSSGNAGNVAMMVEIDLFIDPECDTGKAMNILKESVVTSKYVYISKKFPYTILLEDHPYYKRIRAKAYVNDLRNEFEFRSEVTRRAWIEFKKEGIKPPRYRIPVGEPVDSVSRS